MGLQIFLTIIRYFFNRHGIVFIEEKKRVLVRRSVWCREESSSPHKGSRLSEFVLRILYCSRASIAHKVIQKLDVIQENEACMNCTIVHLATNIDKDNDNQ